MPMDIYTKAGTPTNDPKVKLVPEVTKAIEGLTRTQAQINSGRQNPSSDWKLLTQVSADINTLLAVLGNPVFQQICRIQDSVSELSGQLGRHPSCTSADFDITPEGKLNLRISPQEDSTPFDKTPLPDFPRKLTTPPPPITTLAYAEEFEKAVNAAAQGRDIQRIRLYKPDGASLGFSVVGLKSNESELGIFIQELQPGGIAARDGRLGVSDQILAIDGQVLDTAITHQQAIGILQQAKGQVDIVIAKAKESESTSLTQEHPIQENMVVSTDFAQVEEIHLENDGTGLGFGIVGGRSTGVVVKTILPGGVADRQGHLQSGDHILQINDVNLLGMGSDQVASVLRQCGNFVRLIVARPIEPQSPAIDRGVVVSTSVLGDPDEVERILQGRGLPEVEIVNVELVKDGHGLGVTIAGYVCEKEELSGIFVKSINEGSAADVSGKIQINDRIVEVDGVSLQGLTNHEAVEVLRQTGEVVQLHLERYHHGSKFEQLQSAISHSEQKPPTPSSVSALSLPQVPVESDSEEDSTPEPSPLLETVNPNLDIDSLEILIDTHYSGSLSATVEAAIIAKWSQIMGPDVEIVVAQLAKDGGGLGISLEGTVDVEDGREVRPHHYIRSILADGPVGRNGKLKGGDELLEVNGQRLLGLNHVEVVSVLKELPTYVRVVCARRPGQVRPIDTAQEINAFAARSLLGGSLGNLFPSTDRLVKAKSDGSLASTTSPSLSKVKSRSLEPLSGLAMWSSEAQIIELPKGERGLGFSILDYQDPLNPTETVIVIRSLVPGGVAQVDGRLIPGDRLLAVNDVNLENSSLDQAVQALKGAPRGIVRIAVAKPLPIPDTPDEPPPLPISPPPGDEYMQIPQPATERLLDSGTCGDGNYNRRQSDNQSLSQPPPFQMRTPADGHSDTSGEIPATKASPPPFSFPTETTTVYINNVGTFDSNLPPQVVQKRVVTHVTIFPSPPGDDKTTNHMASIIPPPTSSPPANNVDQAKSSVDQVPTRPLEDTSVSAMATEENHAESSLTQVESPEEKNESIGKASTAPAGTNPDSTAVLLAKHWGPEKVVEVYREPNKSLGGKVDLYNAGPDSGSSIAGIFIKNVLPNSPAGKSGQLKTGSRILAVDDVDLRSASHEKAVEVIRAAGNPVRFLVQSLIQWSDSVQGSLDDSETSKSESTDRSSAMISKSSSTDKSTVLTKSSSEASASDRSTVLSKSVSDNTCTTSTTTTDRSTVLSKSCSTDQSTTGTTTTSSSSTTTSGDRLTQKQHQSTEDEDEPGDDGDGPTKVRPHLISPARTPEPQVLQPGIDDQNESQGIIRRMSSEDTVEDEGGRILTKAGEEIDRMSAGNLKTQSEEDEDEFGYTWEKIKKRWGELGGELLVADLERSPSGLGLSLAGHKDRRKMAVFICGINPAGLAHKSHILRVGDEILEVNGNVLYGRCHLNASALIKSLPHNHVKIIALRRPDATNVLAVKPVVQFPLNFEAEKPEEKYASYKGLRVVTLHKSSSGLGIMIMEGRHADLGQGIFISDIQEGSVAESQGLFVGDMILAVNGIDFVGMDHDQAASILKKTEGNVVLVVCNVKRPEETKQKPVPPPKPKVIQEISPLTCQILPGQETTIEINKDRGLGISIVGGQDTPFGSVIIQEVYPDGAAARDGRLLPGDQLISVNNEDFSNITHARALGILRQTPSRLKITVYREPGTYETLEVELHKKSTRGLGLSIVARRSGKGVFISDVVPGGAAELDGRLLKGDRILSVNGHDLSEATQEEAAVVLKTASGRVLMEVGRWKGRGDGSEVCPKDVSPLRKVILERGSDGLGFSIVGGFSHGPSGPLPVYVKTVFERGAAAIEGTLRRGDQILSVNGISLEGVPHSEAVGILKEAQGTVVLTVLP